MVHAIRILKCKKGHSLYATYDSNECGCCNDGKSYLILKCRECFEEELKSKDKDYNFDRGINIPLDEDGVKAIKELLK